LKKHLAFLKPAGYDLELNGEIFRTKINQILSIQTQRLMSKDYDKIYTFTDKIHERFVCLMYISYN